MLMPRPLELGTCAERQNTSPKDRLMEPSQDTANKPQGERFVAIAPFVLQGMEVRLGCSFNF